MYFNDIDEKSSIAFVDDLLGYYSSIDNGSINRILTSKDEESRRNNVGWYQHNGTDHKIFINVPNMLNFTYAVDRGIVDSDAYYAFLTLCVGHEFRHFQQGRCIWEGKDLDGFDSQDALNSQLVLYVRYFYDAYYLLNKGYVKYEEDAEKFAVQSGLAFLKNNFPNMNAEKAMVDAVRYYAFLQEWGGITPTLPKNCNSTKEILTKIDERISANLRNRHLTQTLFVYNPRFYENHFNFGLDEKKLLTDDLIERYYRMSDGSKQDLLVANAILASLEKPVESLKDFPSIKEKVYKK